MTPNLNISVDHVFDLLPVFLNIETEFQVRSESTPILLIFPRLIKNQTKDQN